MSEISSLDFSGCLFKRQDPSCFFPLRHVSCLCDVLQTSKAGMALFWDSAWQQWVLLLQVLNNIKSLIYFLVINNHN